jgi:Ricin-type beta-trefoil lectin domain-like/HYR domain/Secretion system C-terminal sorting domain
MNKQVYLRLLVLLMALTPLSIFASNNYFTSTGKSLVGCEGVSVTGGSGSIVVSGLGSYSHIQVFTPNFASNVFDREITTSSITVPIATAGSYIVKIWSNPNPAAFCEENFPVTVGGGGGSTLTITCPTNITVSAAAGASSAVVNYANATATTTCASNGATVTLTSGLASGSAFPVGVSQVCFKATDNCGNSKECCISVTVNAGADPCATDTQAPTFTNCPTTSISATAAAGATCANVTYTTPTATDNCGTPTVTRTVGLASGSCFPIGTTMVKFMATDAKGNSAICVFNVVVTGTADPCATDATAPVFTNCPSSVTVTAAAGASCATVNYAHPTATDNCGTPTVTRALGLASGSCFPIGTTLVKFMATDAKGNSAICVFNVVVNAAPNPCANDTQAPVISCPAAITKDVTGMSGTCWNITYGHATATDNCGTATVVRESGLASGSCFPIGVSHVVFKATDAKGNVSRCTLVITITKAQTCAFNANKCYKIVNRNSGKVLDVSGWSTSNNGVIQQYTYGGGNNQKWRIVSVGSGFYKIVNVHSGKVLANHNTYDGSPCYQYDYYTGGAKDWRIECIAGGYTKITHRASGRCLDTEGYGSSTANGQKATIQNCDGTNSQQWQIVEVSCANYVHANSSQLLTMSASAEPNRSRLEFVSNTGYMNDFFKVEKVNTTTGKFDQLEIVANKNSTETLEHYVVYDANPLEGDNIYRVTVFYNDGTSKATDLQTVNFKGLNTVRVFPNPADDMLDVDLSKYKGEDVSLQLFNRFGQQVQVINVEKAGGTTRLDLSSQPTGDYLLRIASKGKRDVMQKVVIAK